MHASLQQKELVIQERDAQIQQLSYQLREKEERLEQREAQLDEIIQQKTADISTLRREVQRLQVGSSFSRGALVINYNNCETLQESLRLLEGATPLKVYTLLFVLIVKLKLLHPQ